MGLSGSKSLLKKAANETCFLDWIGFQAVFALINTFVHPISLAEVQLGTLRLRRVLSAEGEDFLLRPGS